MNTLAITLQDKLNRLSVSIREAGRQIGVSATTVSRVLNGESVDMETLILICRWLKVSPSDILDAELDDDRGLGSKIASVLSTNPEIYEVFEGIINKLGDNVIDMDIARDLVAYATWRLNTISGKVNNAQNKKSEKSGASNQEH